MNSDLVLTNNAVATSANFSAGYNGGSALNLPKGSVTLNNASTLTVTGTGAMNFGESDGSDMTMNINDTASVTVGGYMGVGMNGSGKGTVNINGGSLTVGNINIASAATMFPEPKARYRQQRLL